MKNFFKNINKKIYGNIGLFFVVGVICVFGIITSTLSRTNKQIGDIRGDSTYLTPTGSCSSCDCSCICQGNSSCLTSCSSTCVTPTTVPTLTCSQQCTGITDPASYDSCMRSCNGYANTSPTSVIPTPACGSACNYETQTCSYGQCINKADRCANDSITCDSGCSTASYYCNGTRYERASCIPPSCPVSTCPVGESCHGESYSLCCDACSNCVGCVRLVVDVAVPTTIARTCPPETCPSTCHTNVVEITNADCSTSICPSNCSTACSGDTCCPQAGFCGSGCGSHGTVPNGSCGTIDCGCTECVTCSPQCGQTKNCGGTCSSADTGSPGGVNIVSPIGTAANPVVLSGSSALLRWTASTNPLVDFYRVRVTDPANTTTYFLTDNLSPTDTSVTVSGLNYGVTYGWVMRPYNNTCASVGVSTTYPGDLSQWGYFILNQAPTFGSLVIKSSDNTVVPVQAGNRNQICQLVFSDTNGVHDRRVTFSVTVSDSNGGAGIDRVRLRLRNGTTDYAVATFDSVAGSSITGNGASYWGSGVTTSISGNNRTVNFPIEFTENFNAAIYDLEVYARDANGGEMTNIWEDSGRDFKVWDCKVPVEGTLYDGSSELFGPVCETGNGFSNDVDKNVNFNSLVFDGITPAIDKTMNVNSPFYISAGNDLVWGMQYTIRFPNDFLGTDPVIRMIDLGNDPDTVNCQNTVNFTLGNPIVNSYSDSPRLRVDFSSILDQESWFQTVGGGINSKSVITNNVPETCSFDETCEPVISRETIPGSLDSSLIAGTDIKNDSGCGSSCSFGESNNWSVKQDVIGENYTYKYFYDRYHTALGQGIVLNGDTDLSTITQTGVVFINGNLNVTEDKIINPGQFLMLIVNGNISIADTVNRVDGIFVADRQISVVGKSETQLEINGMIYSSGSNVSITRGYITKELNNTSPAVIVKYRPDFIFSMPGELVKVLSGWREGI